MTLEEAIKRCEEVAEEFKEKLNVYENLNEGRPLCTDKEMKCRCYADDYRQLAKCLKELKQSRMLPILDKIKPEIINACSGNLHMPTSELSCEEILEIDNYRPVVIFAEQQCVCAEKSSVTPQHKALILDEVEYTLEIIGQVQNRK